MASGAPENIRDITNANVYKKHIHRKRRAIEGEIERRGFESRAESIGTLENASFNG
jgi:hypothetical protein